MPTAKQDRHEGYAVDDDKDDCPPPVRPVELADPDR